MIKSFQFRLAGWQSTQNHNFTIIHRRTISKNTAASGFKCNRQNTRKQAAKELQTESCQLHGRRQRFVMLKTSMLVTELLLLDMMLQLLSLLEVKVPCDLLPHKGKWDIQCERWGNVSHPCWLVRHFNWTRKSNRKWYRQQLRSTCIPSPSPAKGFSTKQH